ncbi:MAG: hypothetical protein IMF10_09070 [Proteobacteria bacterium]|nr:hypothetical protein [Pseudomonadota bacterium]
MPTREEVLHKETFKEFDNVKQRVFHTLTQYEKINVDRNSKLLSILIDRLRKTDALSEDELDEILLDII